MHRVLTAGLVAVLALSLVPSASAQDATLSGQVLDQDGQPVAGANVSLSQWGETDEDVVEECSPDGMCRKAPGPGSYHEASAVTGADGRFSLPAMDRHGSLSVWKEGHAHAYVEFQDASQPLEVELVKFPEKTAHIQGTVRGSSGGLSLVSISVENPQYGVDECSARPGDELRIGQTEPAHDPGGDEPVSDGGSTSSGNGTAATLIAPDDHRGCAITVQQDGRFEGRVTPGYSIIRFHHDDWAADGPQYHSASRAMDLPAGQTTQIDVQLTARPGPDAMLGGHVIDKDTKKAIPGVTVSFSGQDTHGWAQAQTDKDGSYQVRLRSGFTQIHVWADGYFPWEGQVTVRSGAEGQRFTVELTKGEARRGGCCIAYGMEGEVAAMGVEDDAMATDEKAAGGPGAQDTQRVADGEGQGSAFEDLGGGLGPYDAAKAGGASGEPAKGAPGFEVVALGLGLLAVVLVIRRR